MNWEYSYPSFLAVLIRVAGLSSTKWAQAQAVSSLSHFGPWNTSLNFTSYKNKSIPRKFQASPLAELHPQKIYMEPKKSPNWKGTSSSIHLHFLVQNVNFSGCKSLKVIFSSEDKPYPPQNVCRQSVLRWNRLTLTQKSRLRFQVSNKNDVPFKIIILIQYIYMLYIIYIYIIYIYINVVHVYRNIWSRLYIRCFICMVEGNHEMYINDIDITWHHQLYSSPIVGRI